MPVTPDPCITSRATLATNTSVPPLRVAFLKREVRRILRLALRSRDLRTEQSLSQRLPELTSMAKFRAEQLVTDAGIVGSRPSTPHRAREPIRSLPFEPRVRRRTCSSRGRWRTPPIARTETPRE